MRYYAHPLGATFCSGAPGIRGLVVSPPLSSQISRRRLSMWLWLTVGTVAAFSPEQTSHTRFGLARRQPAQISWPRFLLGMEGPGLEQRLRGWNGDRGERGGERGGTFEPVFPFTASSPLLFFLLIIRASGTCTIWGERRDTKCRQILKVAADYFRRRKCWLLLWGLRLIRLSAAGVEKETQTLLFEKIQTSYVFIWPPSLWQTPLEQSSSTTISSSLVSMCHVSLTCSLAVQCSRAPAALNAPNVSGV